MPEWIQRAYEILVSHTAETTDGIPRARAEELLVAHEDFSEDAADAEYAIDRLLSRGWLYEVDGELRITDRDR
jgi:hypothetical protein